MISEITHNGKDFQFIIGKCIYHCDDVVSLEEIRVELIKQQRGKLR